MAAGLSSQSRLPFGAIDVMREHVFIDTTLFHPALIRASIDLLGADHVVAGSRLAPSPATGLFAACWEKLSTT